MRTHHLVSLVTHLSGPDLEVKHALLKARFGELGLQRTEYTFIDRRDGKAGDIRVELRSLAGEVAPLAEHLEALRADFPADLFGDSEYKFDLDIAVFHDTYDCSLELPAGQTSDFLSRGLDLTVCTYPTNFDRADNDSVA